MISPWVLIIIVLTGQRLALGQPNEASCLADLEQVRAGVFRQVTLDNGLVLPVMEAVECVSTAEFEARKGGGV